MYDQEMVGNLSWWTKEVVGNMNEGTKKVVGNLSWGPRGGGEFDKMIKLDFNEPFYCIPM